MRWRTANNRRKNKRGHWKLMAFVTKREIEMADGITAILRNESWNYVWRQG